MLRQKRQAAKGYIIYKSLQLHKVTINYTLFIDTCSVIKALKTCTEIINIYIRTEALSGGRHRMGQKTGRPSFQSVSNVIVTVSVTSQAEW